MSNAALMIKTDSENEVLAKIEQVSDTATKNALRSLFFWRMATQTIVDQAEESSVMPSRPMRSS